MAAPNPQIRIQYLERELQWAQLKIQVLEERLREFYAAGEIFFAQAMIDNIASWLCEALPMAVAGGEWNFGKVAFVRQLEERPGAAELLRTHKNFVKEVNRYRQVWIHTLAGGAIPLVDDDPFLNPEGANRHLGVPIDPAINVDEPGYRKRVEECAEQNEGRYCYAIDEFTPSVSEVYPVLPPRSVYERV